MAHLLLFWVALSGVPADTVAAQVKKTYGLHPTIVRATEALVTGTASTVAQQKAEVEIVNGGIYSIGALSKLVNEGNEEVVLAVASAREPPVEEGRTAAATRLFVDLLRRFPLLQTRALASEFARDRLLVLVAANTVQARVAVDSLSRRPLPGRYRAVVNWLVAQRPQVLGDASALVQAEGDAGVASP